MLHQVGVGALGPVFRTYEPTRDRLVAVKVFRLDITPEQAQTLADELAVAADAGLFHPSIVEPLAAGVEGTVAYRAEEYVAAESLDVAMRHYAPAPVEKVLPFIRQLAAAIDFARTAGIGHGALHPRDVFLTPDEARATGFGVVEALERVGLRAPVRRPYSAPERVNGGAWSTPADVFSLAAITYELLTARRPSGTGSAIGALSAAPDAQLEALNDVLARAMSEDPAARYQSALEFTSALDAAAAGEESVAAAAAPAVKAATPIASSDEPDVEDAALGMSPPVVVDDRAEPGRAEQGLAEEVEAAQQEDDAFTAFEHERTERGADDHQEEESGPEEELPPLIGAPGRLGAVDQHALDDFDLVAEPRSDTDQFADEFGAAADEPASRGEPPRRSESTFDLTSASDSRPRSRSVLSLDAVRPADRSDDVSTTAYDYASSESVDDRSRYTLGGVAVMVALALLVGFAAGWMVRGTSQVSVASNASPAAGAKPYSEQSVPSPPTAATGQPSPDPRASAAPSPAPPAAEPLKSTPEPEISPTATPPATSGRLVVQSSPSGAGVTVNGRWRGRTPLTLDRLRFGDYAIRVVQPGFRVASEKVTLSGDSASRTLSVKLQRETARTAQSRTPPATRKPESFTGSIYVDSRPRGASVFVDGQPMGTTPVRIPDVRAGSHVVKLQLQDHSAWTTTIRVTSGEESRVTGSLERIR